MKGKKRESMLKLLLITFNLKSHKMKIKRYYFILLLLFAQAVCAQQNNGNNFFINIKDYDISNLLTTKYIYADNVEKIEKAEPIGFIGNDYQRLYIHFLSVTKNPENPYEYLVTGKTKVKQNVRKFQGTLRIKKANLESNSEYPEIKEGNAICEVAFYEDKRWSATGVFSGEMNLGYILDKNNKLQYNALFYYADVFGNNQFRGKWTSYKTKQSKKCNWGDYRIPESGDLDNGVGEFVPNSKYFDKGWKYYIMSISGDNKLDIKMGKNKEAEKWWK